MANFTFADQNAKIVLHSWGRFKAVLYEAVEVGDLLYLYASAAATAVRLATAASRGAKAVACQAGIAGEEITCALAAELRAPSTIGAGGVVTKTYFAGAADYLGKPLYLGTAGKCSDSAGVVSQVVGFLSARDTIVLTPGGSIAGTDASYTTLGVSGLSTLDDALVAGTLAVGETLAQTGIATFAAESVHSAGINIATLKTLRMPATDYAADGAITPKGFATLSKSSAAAMTVAAGTPGDILGIYSLTAQAHVITFTGQTWDGTNDVCTLGGAKGDGGLFLCISSTIWVCLSRTNLTGS